MRALTAATVHTLAAPRDGVVDHKALVAAGIDPRLPSREVRARRWCRLAPGVYLTAPGPASVRQRCYAASLHAGPDAFITGAAGCVLRGLQLPVTTAVLALAPHHERQVRSAYCQVIRSRHAVDGDVIPQGDGLLPIRVAVLEQCVADAVRAATDLASARSIACKALRDRRVDWAVVAHAASRPGPGAGHFRRVVDDLADGVRSPAEGDLHDALMPAARAHRLPSYLLNPDVFLDGVLLGSPDAWFVGLGFGHEQDSREWHGAEHELDATLVRHEAWRRAGLHLDHATPARFRAETSTCLANLEDLARERRALVVPEPPGLVVLGRGPLLPARTPWPQVDARRAA